MHMEKSHGLDGIICTGNVELLNKEAWGRNNEEKIHGKKKESRGLCPTAVAPFEGLAAVVREQQIHPAAAYVRFYSIRKLSCCFYSRGEC